MENRSKNLIILLIFSFINYSCYSYFEISPDKLLPRSPKAPVMFEMKNKDSIQTIIQNIKVEDDRILIVKDTSKVAIKFSDIEKISVEKFDFLKILALPVFISVLTVIFILMLVGFGIIPHFKIDG
jgi:hypothetical protein